MRIAYLINHYPAVSHSFIRREILALERQGHEVLRISMRGWNEVPPGKEDQVEHARTRFVLQGGAGPLVLAFLRVLFSHPIRLANAIGLTWKLSRQADRPLPVHLIYLLEACVVVGLAQGRQGPSTCTRISGQIRQKWRCWCANWGDHAGVSPRTGRKNSTRRSSLPCRKRSDAPILSSR